MEETKKVRTLPMVSFEEVHRELAEEAAFLDKDHDIGEFNEKATFLKDCGFGNSIATEIYDGISKNAHVFNDYKRKYPQNSFILEAQLKRLCEKYNLFVRDPKFFLGDVPKVNISEMMKFRVHLDDLQSPIRGRLCEDRDFTLYNGEWLYELPCKMGFDFKRRGPQYSVALGNIKRLNYRGTQLFPKVIQVAAIKDLFAPQAFERSNARILSTAELEPQAQVDTDPIVLVKTKHGYLIVTAWGDEANDELVLNINKN